MPVYTTTIELSDRDCRIVDITERVQEEVSRTPLSDGLVTVFVPGSTGGVIALEHDPGVVNGLEEAFDRLAPRDLPYRHDRAWRDANGYPHARPPLAGPSLSVPLRGGRLALGAWQQIAFVDFDNRSRRRVLIVQVMGD